MSDIATLTAEVSQSAKAAYASNSHGICHANARKMAALSHAARKAKRSPKPKPDSKEPIQENAPNHANDIFSKERLSRTREQLTSLSSRLDGLLKDQTLDPRAVKDTTAALAELSDLERTLAGRPLPGSYRPSMRSKRGQSLEP